jgi:hypothetical protein
MKFLCLRVCAEDTHSNSKIMLLLDVISDITLSTYYLYHQQEIFSHYGLSPKDHCSAFFQRKKKDFVCLFNLNIVVSVRLSTISSRSQTHPSHSQTSRLLSSYLLGLPFTRSTQCVRVSVTVLLFVREE